MAIGSLRLYRANVTQAFKKVHPITGHEDPEVEQRFSFTLSLTLALDGDGWSTPRPARFTLWKPPVPIVYGAGWAPEQVWTDCALPAHTRVFT